MAWRRFCCEFMTILSVGGLMSFVFYGMMFIVPVDTYERIWSFLAKIIKGLLVGDF